MKACLSTLSLLFLLAGWSSASGPVRTWTDVDDRKIEASIKEASDSTVSLILAGGRVATVPLSRLSAGDAAYVKQWREKEELRRKNFSIRVLKTDSGPLGPFLKRNTTRVEGVRGGKLASVTIFEEGTSLYEVDVKDDHVMVQVLAEMVPPRERENARVFSLAIDELALIYEDRDGNSHRAKVGPRWLKGADTKLGKETTIRLEGDHSVEFGVGFVLPENARVKALDYEGDDLRLYVAIR